MGFVAINGSFAALLALAITFVALSADAYDACYVDPCYRGWGLQEMWKINKGVGSAAIAAGCFSAADALAGLALFGALRHSAGSSAHLVVGLFAGVTLSAGLVMVNQSATWCAEWDLVGDLTKLHRDNEVFTESGRHMRVDTTLIAKCKALALVAAFGALLHFVVVAQLVAAQRAVIAKLRLLGGGAAGDAVAVECQLDDLSARLTDGDGLQQLPA